MITLAERTVLRIAEGLDAEQHGKGPTVARLIARGLLVKDTSGPRPVYRLTPAGHAALATREAKS